MVNLYVTLLLGILTVSPIHASIEDLLSEPPVLKVYEVDEDNIIVKEYKRGDPKDPVYIINTAKHIRLECIANYPVQWVYTGTGIPLLSTKIDVSNTENKYVNQYSAKAFLSPLNERHTGSYRCSHTESLTLSPFLHIYVPGTNVFTSLEGKTIHALSNDTSILIPCDVSHPKARVLLYKTTNGGLVPPTASDDAYTYSPRKGFRIDLNKFGDIDGTYVCVATYKDIGKSVDYSIVSTSQKFGELIQGQEETCIGESCASRCETHSDCPESFHCYTDRRCHDPCIFSIRCGRDAMCRLINDYPVCYCPDGFVGDANDEKTGCFIR